MEKRLKKLFEEVIELSKDLSSSEKDPIDEMIEYIKEEYTDDNAWIRDEIEDYVRGDRKEMVGYIYAFVNEIEKVDPLTFRCPVYFEDALENFDVSDNDIGYLEAILNWGYDFQDIVPGYDLDFDKENKNSNVFVFKMYKYKK